MPGLNIVYNKDGFDGPGAGLSFLPLPKEDSFDNKLLYRDSVLCVSIYDREDYPYIFFEKDEYLFFLEGKIYDNDIEEVKKVIFKLSVQLFNEISDYKSKLIRWLKKTDGDFIILIYNKITQKLIVFNDLLGRLPFYLTEKRNQFQVSRNIGFILCNKSRIEYDLIGIAQYLYFGYPLHCRTLFSGIQRLFGGIILEFDGKNFKKEYIHVYNFDEKEETTLKNSVNELVDLFNEASKKRFIGQPNNLLLLSGGLDSRAVAASIKNNFPVYNTATFDMRGVKEDVVAAKKIADHLNVSWRKFDIGDIYSEDYLQLLNLKSGLDYFGATFLIPFYRQIVSFYGKGLNVFTGDGGDKTLPQLTPSIKIKSLSSLSKYIIENKGIATLENVLGFTGIKADAFINELEMLLDSYPETIMKNKFIHFLIYERAAKFLFEGEDRNRCFFWSVSPFYSIPFFSKAMSIPDRLKKGYKLYEEFLKALSPGIIKIENAFWKYPINSYRFKLIMCTKNNVFPYVPNAVKLVVKNKIHQIGYLTEDNSNKYRLLKKQLLSPVVLNILNTKYLESKQSFSDIELNYLFTISCLISKLSSGECVLSSNPGTIL